MSETIRLLHGSSAAARRTSRRTGWVVAGLILLFLLGGVAYWVASSQPALPDRLQVLSAGPVASSPGEFEIIARLTRADGGRLVSFASDGQLINPSTGRPLLQHQSGFARSDGSHRFLDVVMQGTLPAHTAEVPALVIQQVRAIPVSEQLHWTARTLSGNRLPAPRPHRGTAPVLSCLVRLPAGISAER